MRTLRRPPFSAVQRCMTTPDPVVTTLPLITPAEALAPTEPPPAPPVPKTPSPPLISRAADAVAASAAEHADYYGVAVFSLVIDRAGIYQIRSTNIDVNTLIGALTRATAYLTSTFPQTLPPGQAT